MLNISKGQFIVKEESSILRKDDRKVSVDGGSVKICFENLACE